MNKTTVTNLVRKDTNELVGIKVKTHDDEFTIPVVDATKSERNRMAVNEMIKANNKDRGSKFMKTSYSIFGYRYN